ncbi:MAG: S8 family serine peptidase [Kineosporiaceae bacterium]
MRPIRTSGLAAALAAAVLGTLAGALPTAGAAPAPPVADGVVHRWIVRATDASTVASGTLAAQLKTTGARVIAGQPRIGSIVVDATAAQIGRVRDLPSVAVVAADRSVPTASLGFTPSSQPGAMTNVTRITGAQEMWKAGYTGAGVDVAIIDTGVAPVSGLKDPGKVFVGPDLSFESQSADTRYLDSYGHGTNMAGIIAGRETAKASGATYAADTTNFYGMAPDARLVSIKLGDRNGAVDVSQMIAAIDWVIANRQSNGLNIRVLNLSYGNISSNDNYTDPVSWAAESAWKANITVVASGGNDGVTQKGLASPGFNRWIITVGAADTKGTDTHADDTLAPFSQVGTDGKRGPDFLAPGVGIVSLGVPGSKILSTYTSAKIGNNFLRGNGTSQAAAVVSGAAALILQKYPNLRNDDVKAFLKQTANPIGSYTTAQQGRGVINLRCALSTAPATNTRQTVADATGTGTLDKARGGNYVTIGGAPLTGETDIMGMPWDSASIASKIPWGLAWSWDGQFNGSYWLGTTGYTADTTSWAGRTWSGRTWSGRTWSGRTWSGRTWSGGAWNGSGWTSATWTSPVATPAWASSAWYADGWK